MLGLKLVSHRACSNHFRLNPRELSGVTLPRLRSLVRKFDCLKMESVKWDDKSLSCRIHFRKHACICIFHHAPTPSGIGSQNTSPWKVRTSIYNIYHTVARPLFTMRTDVLPQDLGKSRSREIWVSIFPIALKFDSHLGSSAVEMPVKFQSDTIIIPCNPATSRLHEFGQ